MGLGSWSPAVDAILSAGERLTALGSWNWALSKAAALSAVRRIGDLEIAILGGDVYRREGSELVFDYGGWAVDVQADEDRNAFIARSLVEAVTYISAYPSEHALFAIVPNVQAGKEFTNDR
jgi:hypothetical protein